MTRGGRTTSPDAEVARSVDRATTRTLEDVRDADGLTTSRVQHTQLPCGLRIVTEEMAGARSAALGVLVDVGSRDESDETHGASHFLEHLLFKGTGRRTALDISIAFDAVGGEFNAFTAKEYTCFHAIVLADDLPMAIDAFGDMVTDPLLTSEDVDAEREVILDEIAMHADDPEDVAHNLMAEAAWGAGTSLGRPIAGTVGSIRAMEPDTIRRFHRDHYRPESMVIAAAGAVDHASVVAQVEAAFAGNDFLLGTRPPRAPRPSRPALPVTPGERRVSRPLEQVSVVLAHEGLDRYDERRFALGVLGTALGGGTSSRLFQEVRERRGLAYGVYSFLGHYADSGLAGVAVGCLPERVEETLVTVREELGKVASEGITGAELARGKSQLIGGLVLGLEDPGSRMMRIGRAELNHGEVLGIDEITERVNAVSGEDVRRVAAHVFEGPEVLAVVGPDGA
ncbi:insulinase family protein [Nocardioides panacisoli]|uniref:M16 family metallopeptidase n=1 Tax=Nocardioides panacisoli TaxID=627624 RepID=UPI001C63229F|nr:pitrilysin family protein [Nocardioides panacisoli]QYJ05544.1 insulinase family protein [Nocardioides panacisoli]